MNRIPVPEATTDFMGECPLEGFQPQGLNDVHCSRVLGLGWILAGEEPTLGRERCEGLISPLFQGQEWAPRTALADRTLRKY